MASADGPGTGGRTDGRRGTSPAVYRRRRLAVGVLTLLLIAAVVVGAVVVTGLLGRDAEPGPAAAPTASAGTPGPVPSTTAPPPSHTATASPTASPTATALPTATATDGETDPGATCSSTAVTLRAETDAGSYGPGEQPVLSLVVTNDSDTACTVNVGTSQMEFVLTLDDERVFSSADCQDGAEDLELVIEPDDEERATFEWDRNRTAPGCDAVDDGEAAEGTYTLVTRLGARSSNPVTFTLS